MRPPTIPEPRIHPSAFLSPGVQVHGAVTVGPEAFLLFGVVIRAELDTIDVGAQTNIQDNSVLHCDEGVPCVVGSRVTVGHAAVVHGAVIEDRALIGIGARVLNRAHVGTGAWIAAGSVLTEGSSVPEWTLAMGTPAKPVRDLTDSEIQRADEGVHHYLELATRYREIFS